MCTCKLLLERAAVLAVAVLTHLSGAVLLFAAETTQSEGAPCKQHSLPPAKALIALPPLGPADLGSLETTERLPRPVGTNRFIPVGDFEGVSAREGDAWENTVAGPLWRLRIQSPGAKALRLRFRDFSLGEGRLWIHGKSGEGFGPYSGTGPFGDGEFWTPSVQGEIVFVEYWPFRGQFPSKEVPFRIDQIGHLWKSLIESQQALNSAWGGEEESKQVATTPRAVARRKVWARSVHAPVRPEPRLARAGWPAGFSLPAVGRPTIFVGADSYRFELLEPAEQVEFVVGAVDSESDIDLFVRFGRSVEVRDGEVVADYESDRPTGEESIILSRDSDPPLRAGTYFVALGNHGSGLAAEGTLLVTARYNNQSCFNDVTCRDAEWGGIASAIAIIEFSGDNGFRYACSGALMSDRHDTFTPYFLTAAHCISSQREARSVEAHWYYQNATCSGSHQPYGRDRRYQVTHGAELLAYEDGSVVPGRGINPRGDGDMALLELAQPPPRGVWFLGWTTYAEEIAAGRNVVGIHHSESLHKQIGFGQIVGGFLDYRTSEHMSQVDWGQGLAQTGASGSPLLNEDGQILGVLSGGRDDDSGCFNPGSPPVYSNFRSFYPKVSAWLKGDLQPTREIMVSLGISGDKLTISARSDGTYWLGDSQLTDGTLVTAANGSKYRLRLSGGGWTAEYVATTTQVSLIDDTDGIAAVRAEDGSYWLDGQPLKDGAGLTHALHGTYKLVLDGSSGAWHAKPIPAGALLEAPGLRVETIAGTGLNLFGGDGREAKQAHLANPSGVAVDIGGNILIADTENHRIRNVSLGGIITTMVGTGTAGFSGDGGEATKARLSSPRGIAVGGDGKVYISDSGNNRIRVIRSDRTIGTVVGGGVSGFAADAALKDPHSVALDREGNLYIADTGNHRIRKVAAGTITTIAGTGHVGYSGDGRPARLATLRFPKGVAVDAAGIVYIADTGNNRVRRIGRNGNISTVMGTGQRGFSGDGGQAANAPLTLPRGLVSAPDGSLYVSDSGNHAIRRIDAEGVVFTVAGTGVAGSSLEGDAARQSKLSDPVGLAIDADGRLLVADSGNRRVRRLEPDWNLLPPDALPLPELVPLGVTGDWARLWRTSNSKYYHRGSLFESGNEVFGWFDQPYRLEYDAVSGWSSEPIEIDYASTFQDRWSAATKGDANAQRSLGVRYALGLGVEEDHAEALRWFRLAAQQGNAGAESWLGWMHENGIGVAQDALRAAEWYGLAAPKGDAWAQYRLGNSYRLGEGVNQDLEEAVHWILWAAMQDFTTAQNLLGHMYRTGQGLAESPEKAFEWYRLAATAGNPWAQVSLGRAYRNGSGVASDAAKAVKWVRFAADRGHGWGQQELGWMYEFGQGVVANAAEAVKSYRRAAVQGWAYAQWRLGVAYMRGSGTMRDDVVALVWLGLAEANGEERALEELRAVRARLTQEQLARAKSLSARCKESGYEDCP